MLHAPKNPAVNSRRKLLTIFGTRPEFIKLAPVIRQLEVHRRVFQTLNIASGQHTSLLHPLFDIFDVRVDCDLKVMEPDQTPNQVCSRVLSALDSILVRERPSFILVQGDTTTAMAGALAGFNQGIPVGHVEAGLRTGNPYSPYPEEMNRRLISRLATYHFAATPGNRETLLAEGIARENIFVTGNPVVDSVEAILARSGMSPTVQQLLETTEDTKRIVLTTHRRESFGEVMAGNLRVLRRFVESHKDVSLVFPVHPNPSVVGPAQRILSGHPRIHLIQPLNYQDFIVLLSQVWLIVSDSGGIQEEVPTLGKPLLILRENTERPEVVESGIARLVGREPESLAIMLEESHRDRDWADEVRRIKNPFGAGDSGKRIAQIIKKLLAARTGAPWAKPARKVHLSKAVMRPGLAELCDISS